MATVQVVLRKKRKCANCGKPLQPGEKVIRGNDDDGRGDYFVHGLGTACHENLMKSLASDWDENE